MPTPDDPDRVPPHLRPGVWDTYQGVAWVAIPFVALAVTFVVLIGFAFSLCY